MKRKRTFFTILTLIALPLLADDAPKPTVTVGGLGQIQFRGATEPDPGTFLLRRAEVRVTAEISPLVSGYVVLDGARAGSPLQDVVVALRFAPRTFLDAGQFKIPIGYEGDLVSSSALQNIERALFFQARDSLGGGAGDVRDTGMRVRTSAGPLDIQFGVFNGLGEHQNSTATTRGRAGVARVVYNVPRWKDLRFGISAARAGSSTTLHRRIGNAFAVYKSGPATLQAEYVTSDNLFHERGYYAHAGWQLTSAIEGTLRYDTFDFNRRSTAGTAVRDVIAGINYYIRGNNAKIQANVIRRNGGTALTARNGFWTSATAFSTSGTQLRVNVQMGF
jgi:hypothetical protein